jgi:hypothetical protein
MAFCQDDQSAVGPGRDDHLEFEFALSFLMDGFRRLQQQ